jgi:hypothetical protein
MRTVIIAAAGAAALFSMPALTQEQRTTSIPDFSGTWGHPYWPSFEPPAWGPGPVTNRMRLPNGVGNPLRLVLLSYKFHL